MSTRPRLSLVGTATLVALAFAACAAPGSAPSSGQASSRVPSTSSRPAPSSTASVAASESVCQGTGYFEAIPVDAACWIDVTSDDGDPVRVSYTIPTPGWSAFIGAFKEVTERETKQVVSVLIARVLNVTIDACTDQVAVTPPVGPSVDELAEALAHLPPFDVSSPPADVTAWGYSGTHLQTRIPLDQPFDADIGGFVGCDGSVLESWIAPPLSFAFYAYVAPGDTEDFWILDVEGTRVVIAAMATANASDQLLAEQQAVLDSIVIEP